MASVLAAGTALANATAPEKVRIWEIASGKLVREIEYGENDGWVSNNLRIAYTPDGQSVVVVNNYSSSGVDVRRWRTGDGERRAHWKITQREVVIDSLAIHPAGKTLALGAREGVIRLFELNTGVEITPTDLHTGEIGSMAFTPDGRTLMTTAADGTARSWDAGTGQPQTVWPYDGSRYVAQLASDGSVVLDGRIPGKTLDMTLQARDALTGKVLREIPGWRTCRAEPDGTKAWLLIDRGTKAVRWDFRSGEVNSSILIKSGYPIGVAEAGQLVVTVEGARIAGWDAKTRGLRFEWSAKELGLVRDHSPDDPGLIDFAVTSRDGRYIFLTVRTGRAVLEDIHAAYLCELPTGKIVWQLKSQAPLGRAGAFSPDGKKLAFGLWTVKLFDVASGKELAELDGHRGSISALTFSPDGKRLASGGRDGIAMVWEIADIAP